jgi:hypothetical protein
MQLKKNQIRLGILTLIFIFGITMVIDSTSKITNVGDEPNFTNNEKNETMVNQPFLSAENMSTAFKINNGSGTVSSGNNHKIIVGENNNIYTVWTANVGGKGRIYFRVFYYLNQSWGEIIDLSYYIPTTLSDKAPDMAVRGNYAYVTWDRDTTVAEDRYRIYFAAINGEVVEDYRQMSSFASEQIPQIEINAKGDIVLLYRYALDETNLGTRDVRAYIHYSGQPWVTWSTSQTLLSGNSMFSGAYSIDNIRSYWDDNGEMHVAFRYIKTTYYSMYYQKNNSNIGGIYPTFQNVTDDFSTVLGDQPAHLVLEGNDLNDYLYIGWDETGSGNDDIRVFNKTFASANFTSSGCFNITTEDDVISPAIAFDSQNNVLVSWKADSGNQLYYVRNISATEADKELIATSSILSKIVVAPNDDFYFVYQTLSGDLYLRQLDKTNSTLAIISPIHGAAITGTMPIDISYLPDTIVVSYESYDDTNENGVADDASNWELIANLTTSNNSGNFDYTWNMGMEDKLSVFIRVNATDKNYLHDSKILYNISIDNNMPQTVEIVAINDTFGHDAATHHNCKGVISIYYNTVDNASGIEHVEFRNGTQLLASSTNITQMSWITNSSHDGNYTDLYIRAYDRSSLYNDSIHLPYSIYVDNTVPNMTFSNITAGTEYSGAFYIMMNASLDTTYIHCSFSSLNSSTFVKADILRSQSGLATKMNATHWKINWITNYYYDGSKQVILDGYYQLFMLVNDEYNNSQTLNLTVIIDNTAPNPIILNPVDGSDIGFTVYVLATCDNDTVFADIRYRTGYAADHNDGMTAVAGSLINIATNSTNNGTSITCAFELPSDAIGGAYTISIMTRDNQGLIGYDKLSVDLKNSIPIAPVFKTALQFTYNSTGKQYNINVKFSKIATSTKSGTVLVYYIYRSNIDFNNDLINSWNITERTEYLGTTPGEKYCIAVLVYSDYASIPSTPTYVDYNMPSNTYYYAVVGMNEYNNPSLLSNSTKIMLPVLNPDKSLNLEDLKLMPYIFGGVVIIMIGVASSIVKSAKKIRTVKQVKEAYTDILDQEYNVDVDKDEAVSLTDRLDQMEDNMEEQITGETKVRRTRSKDADIDMDDFLTMEVEIKEEESIIGTGGIKKCQGCGWTLSAASTKCPRCGRDFF